MSLSKITSNLFKKCLLNRKILFVPVKKSGHWLKDYKPNPNAPKTEKEIKAAADKYNIIPCEYRSFPEEDGTGYGDYPDIPTISAESKDYNYPWDYPELHRNFGETLNVDEDMIGLDRCDVSRRWVKSKLRFLLEFLGVVGLSTLLILFLEDKKQFLPLIPKQYPGKGSCKHYTFEKIIKSPSEEEEERECPYYR